MLQVSFPLAIKSPNPALMQKMILLTDGSVDAQSRLGYGAYLAVSDADLVSEDLKPRVRVRRFEQTSSTKLELQTLLWALEDIEPLEGQVIIYTDSNNIIGLPGRRERLEQNNYYSGKNRRLNHYDLYQEFFRKTDRIDCKLIKVSGHLASKRKDDIDRLFTLVDRASRSALRAEILSTSHPE
ncbi:MAG: ribonuclease H [Desulfuromonadales bacterium]|jgi:ribonuclease HI|nr:ribonuclease H [Desulfuromonadales bacterium]